MHAPSAGPVLRVILFAGVLCSGPGANAYTYVQVGVDSNFLIDRGRVIFAQADGSLTALDLGEGNVLSRDTSKHYSGKLMRVPAGILVLTYGSIMVLRPDSLAPIWETKCSSEPNVAGDALVSYDGNGLVECRALTDGELRWSYDLPGALQVVSESGKVLIHRAATYEPSDPTTVLLDLGTGKELFRKVALPGVHWNSAFLDGTNIYVQAGPFQGRRSNYSPERLVVWNLRGEETGSLPFPPGWREKAQFRDGSFELSGKTFYKGHVYADRGSMPPDGLGRRGTAKGLVSSETGISDTEYDLGSGLRWVERAVKRRPGGKPLRAEFELRTPDKTWIGFLPYLGQRGSITAAAAANGRILLGSNLGQVECIDFRTGQSLWLYVFPTIRQTMSYSSPYGLPPMMSKAAATFRRENRDIPKAGFQIAGGISGTPRVIRDPKPFNPFRDLPWLLAVTWGGAGAALLGLFGLHLYPKARPSDVRTLALSSALLTVLSFGCFTLLGRVSLAGFVGLILAILAGVVFGLGDVIKCYRNGRWGWATVLALLFGGTGLLMISMLRPFLRL